MTLGMTFQTRFRQAVANSGLSLRRIGERSGYCDPYLGRLLHGKQSNPSLQFVETIAETLGVSVVWLLGLEGTTDETGKCDVLET